MGGFVVGGGACGGFNVLSSKLDDEEKNDAVQGGELQEESSPENITTRKKKPAKLMEEDPAPTPLPSEPEAGSSAAAATPPPPVPPRAVAAASSGDSDAANDAPVMDEETRAAVADLIATNRKLRRAIKERDAERSTLRSEAERLKKVLAETTLVNTAQAEDILALRAELEALKTQAQQPLFMRRASSADGGSLERTADGLPPYQNTGTSKGKRKISHPLTGDLSVVDPASLKAPLVRRGPISRQTSLATADALDALPQFQADVLAQKFVDLYKDPAAGVEYMASPDFAEDILKLCEKAKVVFEAEPRCLHLESPTYVFGDTHGNLEDLHFFSDNLWRLGMQLSAGKFLFLGDYVDRGMSSLEVVTYLIALKTLYPGKLFMLRGNHETRDVNGWEEHYGDRSFIAQCKSRFGDAVGEEVWEELNCVFDRLPLAAVIDRDIFCIHGGIPRPLPNAPEGASRLDMIAKIPAVSGINPPYDHEDEHLRQMASECIWSDPAGEDQEASGELWEDGFGESPRGGGTICFGNKSLDDFLGQHKFSYVMRAHEAHAYGVSLSKKARCFTVFSTSKDHNQGSAAICGCILVDFHRLEVITRSPGYRGQYVHRRDSVSVRSLADHEYEARAKVGLITEGDESSDDEGYDEEYYEEGYQGEDMGGGALGGTADENMG